VWRSGKLQSDPLFELPGIGLAPHVDGPMGCFDLALELFDALVRLVDAPFITAQGSYALLLIRGFELVFIG
jgi:hypothetical protein